MPWYTVGHACSLTKAQSDELAIAITEIHSSHFNAHKAFVNVRFEDLSNTSIYVGGHAISTNRIIAQMRGGARSKQSMEELCTKIVQAWNHILQVPEDQSDRSGPLSLHAISVQACINAGYEAGFFQPDAGGDQDWFNMHRDELTKRKDQHDFFASMIIDNAEKFAA